MPIETHITVSVADTAEENLREWAIAHAFELGTIVLASGAHAHQRMVTAHSRVPLDEALAAARQHVRALHSRGIDAHRLKLEVPLDDRTYETDGAYIEQHVKVFAPRTSLPLLAQIASRFDAHLSRNPAVVAQDGEERFLTQRFAPESRRIADRGLDCLLDALRTTSFTVRHVVRERVVHDDNLALDAGWMKEVVR